MRLPGALRFRLGFVAASLAAGALAFLGWAWWGSYQAAQRLTLSLHARLVIVSDAGHLAVGLMLSPNQGPYGWRWEMTPSLRWTRESYQPNAFQALAYYPFGRMRGGSVLGDQYWYESPEGFTAPYWAVMLLISLLPAGIVGKRIGDWVARHAAPRTRNCLRCGYDLSATPVNSPCPECGLAAHRSVIDHVDPGDCRPSWVRWIAIGSLLLLIAYVMCALYFAYFLFLKRTYQWWYASAFTPIGFNWLMLKAAVLHLLACILLSRDERPRAFAWRPFLLRWALRLLPVPPIFAIGIWVLLDMHVMMWNNSLEQASIALLLPLLVCPTVTFIRVRQLALRLGRRRLAEHIGIVAAGAGASLFIALVGTTFVAEQIRRADAVFYIFLVMPVVFVALFNLWALLMLFVITPKFFMSAREASRRWRTADAARVMV
jgi:hypothetical protein